MLQKIKNEVRMTVVYNIVFYMMIAIIDNEGIDKYLIGELFDQLDAIPYLLAVSALYLIGTYFYKTLKDQVRKDWTELKNELNKGKIEA